jgi:LAO/AO transport system kinase
MMPEDNDIPALKDHAVQAHLDKLTGQGKGKAEEIFSALRSGDKLVLAKAITLAESALEEDRASTTQLMRLCLPYVNSAYRIGITGVPGVGKSTFLNLIAKRVADKGRKVAILTIDPSSPQSGGSILGDKTRMDGLTSDERIFVRPSPSGSRLGGVALRTREAAVLCEAAGFDTIFIETVGVGQSETAISAITDFFLLLALPGAGDELQGIKRGIMELADAIFVNKADGELATLAEIARQSYHRALHLFPARSDDWTPRVLSGSAITGEGIEKVWDLLEEFSRHSLAKGTLAKKREQQLLQWMHSALQEMIALRLNRPEAQALIRQLEAPVGHKTKSPIDAAQEVFDQLFGA